jgi:small-conductance mechanosensitive channel
VLEKQIGLAQQVKRVRRKTRPWRSIIALLLAIAAAVISVQSRNDTHFLFTASHRTDHLVADGTAVLFLIFGSLASYGLAGQARQLLEPRAGTPHAGVVRYVTLLVGGFTTLILTLHLFRVPVGSVVLGGALGTVFVGIAAQQALGNVFAGLVLLFARPFQVGDAVRLRAGALGGTIEGVVTDIGITYVKLNVAGSPVSVPNAQVLNAVVGPIPATEDDSQPAMVSDSKSGTPGGPEQPQPRPPGPA